MDNLYKRAIDDVILIGQRPNEIFQNFKCDFDNRHPSTHFDWDSICREVGFLDLDITYTKSMQTGSIFLHNRIANPEAPFATFSQIRISSSYFSRMG